MKVQAKVRFIRKNLQKVEQAPDKIMYAIARMALDMSFTKIPKLTGATRQTSTSAGVRKRGNSYVIGSYTDYASYIWDMESRISNVNWSEPGTMSFWYEDTWKKKGQKIKTEAINKYGVK